jgi:hypothetical protein
MFPRIMVGELPAVAVRIGATGSPARRRPFRTRPLAQQPEATAEAATGRELHFALVATVRAVPTATPATGFQRSGFSASSDSLKPAVPEPTTTLLLSFGLVAVISMYQYEMLIVSSELMARLEPISAPLPP